MGLPVSVSRTNEQLLIPSAPDAQPIPCSGFHGGTEPAVIPLSYPCGATLSLVGVNPNVVC